MASLRDFAVKYFNEQGGYNPILAREEAKRIRQMERNFAKPAIVKCNISGMEGELGTEIRPAKVSIERDGQVSTYRILVSSAIKAGKRISDGPYRGKVKSCKRAGMDVRWQHCRISDKMVAVVVVVG